jgi:Domain of unknown function (DUF3471)
MTGMPVKRTVAKVDASVLDRYAGKYELRPGFVVTITREGNSLMAQATGQPKFEVFAEAETKFFSETPDLTITFVKAADGKVTDIVIRQNGQDRQGKRIE